MYKDKGDDERREKERISKEKRIAGIEINPYFPTK